MNKLSAAITFISTPEWGVIKKRGDISAHLEGIIGRGGGKIGQNVSQVASRVTDDQNKIIILIVF